ncbi:hypothetical protein Hanom_Chr04g00336881 [Helianthus anomalus]
MCERAQMELKRKRRNEHVRESRKRQQHYDETGCWRVVREEGLCLVTCQD